MWVVADEFKSLGLGQLPRDPHDPRENPALGDVLRTPAGRWWVVAVGDAGAGWVGATLTPGPRSMQSRRLFTRREWRRAMADARVLAISGVAVEVAP